MERIERPDRIDAGREVASVERELWMNEAVGVGMAEPEKEASVCTGDAGAVVVGDAGSAGTAADGVSGLVAAGAVRGAAGVGGVEITSFEVGIFPAGSIATGRVAETIGGVSLGIVPVGPAGRTLVGEAGFDATDAETGQLPPEVAVREPSEVAAAPVRGGSWGVRVSLFFFLPSPQSFNRPT